MFTYLFIFTITTVLLFYLFIIKLFIVNKRSWRLKQYRRQQQQFQQDTITETKAMTEITLAATLVMNSGNKEQDSAEFRCQSGISH